jgi:hypothetical protein
MLKNITDTKELRPTLLSLLSTSGTLAGLSLALTGIVNLRISHTAVGSLADDMFLVAAMGFIIVCCFTFFALKHIHSSKLGRWTSIIDITFLGSHVMLILAGIVTVYEFV